jgi:phage anti-repressor protein
MLTKDSAGNLLPEIINPDGLIGLEDARYLHRKMKIQTNFRDWIKRRLYEFKFSEGVDYFRSNLSESTRGRPAEEYQISFYAALVICMAEKTEYGRRLYLQFVERLISSKNNVDAPILNALNNNVVTMEYDGKKLYHYRNLQRVLGYSTKSSLNNVRRCYANHITMIYDVSFVTQEYAMIMVSRAKTKAICNQAKETEAIPSTLEAHQLMNLPHQLKLAL